MISYLLRRGVSGQSELAGLPAPLCPSCLSQGPGAPLPQASALQALFSQQPEGRPLHSTGSSGVCILGLGMELASLVQARFPRSQQAFQGQ